MNNKIPSLLTILCLLSLTVFSQDPVTVNYYDDLQMDIYLPEDTPDAIVLFVHGGGFSGGSRQNGAVFCRNIMRMNKERGTSYAAITMSYRLLMTGRGFGCDIPAEEKRMVLRENGRDISRAAAWILSEGSRNGLVTDKIILAGSSAGAEGILHAAYWDQTRIDDNGTAILPDEFSYAGIISMAGALIDLNLISKENALPSLFFHGTCDNLVPYASAPHHYCDESEPGYLMLHGSASIADRLAALGANYMLVSECGGGHEWAGKPKDEVFGKVETFLSVLLPNASEFMVKEVISGEVDCDYPDGGVCAG